MRRWGAAAAGLVLAAILLSGNTPWRYTLFGMVAPPDFAQDLAAARVFAAGQNPYEAGIARTHAALMKVSEDQGYQHFPHPPLLFLLVLPLADLTLARAAAIWFGVSLGLLFLLAVVLAESAAGSTTPQKRRPSVALALVIFGGLFLWPPVQYNLAKGQWSILVALLLAMSWQFYVRGHHRSAGASIGLASALKVFPALLGIYLLVRAPRAIVWMVVAVTAAFGVPLLLMGPHTAWAFVQQSQANVSYWETFPAVTYSIHGLLARLLVGGQWARPLVYAPLAARVLGALLSLVLLAIAARTLRRHDAGSEDEGARFAAWIALLVILNPLSMVHSGVILALPILLIAQALSSVERVWPKLAWTIGVVLVSIPGHTLIFLASNPIEPWQGLAVIALPLWGSLLLFSAAVAAIGSPVAAQTLSPRLSLSTEEIDPSGAGLVRPA
jgi:alpha-1,2-mannosyltransferase